MQSTTFTKLNGTDQDKWKLGKNVGYKWVMAIQKIKTIHCCVLFDECI